MLSEVGDATKTGRDHLELAGPRIDMERGARLSGSRFAYLRGELVLLELALVSYAMRKLVGEGFEPVIPPVLVREQALYGTGYLPDTEQQIYHLPDDDLYLVGTSEVALASLHADEILDAEQLPLRYAGFSSCFRREAGAAGKDTRGIFRVHQFDKVEMFAFCEPDQAVDEHQRLLAIEESIMADLEIPYRVVAIAVDDLGASAAMKYDLEAWLPGQGRYRELTSLLEHDRLPGAATGRPLPRADEPAAPRTSRRSTGPRLRSGGRSSRCWRTASSDDGSVRLPAALTPFGAPELLAPAGSLAAPAALADRSQRHDLCCCGRAQGARAAAARRSSPNTINAARGGPHIAILARIRTPKVFHGRTKLRAVSGSRPWAASAIAAANPVRFGVSASARISSSDTGVSIASSSLIASRRWASRETAWISSRDRRRRTRHRGRAPRQHGSRATFRARTKRRRGPMGPAACCRGSARRNSHRTSPIRRRDRSRRRRV